MHVLFLTDTVFALRERALLSRLEVGLAAEGVRVTLAAPEEALARMDLNILGEPLSYHEGAFAFTRRLRAGRLAEDVVAASGSVPVTVVHVFGGSAWTLGVELARMWDAALVLEIWRANLAERARSVAGQLRDQAVLAAPDPSIERAILREGGSVVARLTPWGARADAEVGVKLSPDRATAIMMIGVGRDVASYTSAFDGVVSVVEGRDNAMIFVDSEAARRAGLWERAERLGVCDRLSLIDAMEDRRDLVLRGDMIICPDARGEQRTLLLDAMASAMPVVATEDPFVSSLIDGRTACLLPAGASAINWGETIRSLLDDPERARSLGASARAYVREKHRVSAHVATVLDMYEWATQRTLPFKSGT
jgi:hypothetical protein